MATSIIYPSYKSKQINEIFAKGGDILIKAGAYKITTPIKAVSNTHVVCEDGVLLYKKCDEALLRILSMKCIGEYQGVSDFTWKGGKFTGITNKQVSNLVEMIHARLVTFENVEFISVRGLHFIEINSSRLVTIKNCIFSGHVTGYGRDHKEAIQIDFANIDGFPYADPTAKVYDGTHSKKIVIEGCVFDDCPVCIGTHTVTTLPDKMHESITIKNNKAIGRKKGTFVRLLNMKNVEISGNTISDFEYGIYYERYKTGHLASGGTQELGYFTRNEGVSCHGNKFKNVNHEFYAR